MWRGRPARVREATKSGQGNRARLTNLSPTTRRRFLQQMRYHRSRSVDGVRLAHASSAPDLKFPSQPRERIAIASYPFREFIAGSRKQGREAHGSERFRRPRRGKISGQQDRALDRTLSFDRPEISGTISSGCGAGECSSANIAVDGEHSPYAMDRSEREQAIAFSKQWIDNAVIIGSPSIRTNIPHAKGVKPDLDRTAESLSRVAEYAATKNIVVTLENDNPVSEDPFFLVALVKKVNNPWLHTLPDFGNTLAAHKPDYAYRGLDAMFRHAYCISHVKSSETNRKGVTVHVDMAKAFGLMKQHGYKGYCSMEWDDAGDPYQKTAELIWQTVQYLS